MRKNTRDGRIRKERTRNIYCRIREKSKGERDGRIRREY